MAQAGYSVGLYARVKGIDNKKAYRELLDRECFSIQKSNITISPINEIADIDKRDAVYRTFLNMLKLEKSSRLALNRLGFLNSTIEEQMYRTIPNKSIHRRLIAYRLSKMYDLSGIPGFYQEADFRWTFSAGKEYLYQYLMKNIKYKHYQYIWISLLIIQKTCGFLVKIKLTVRGLKIY